MAYSVVSGQPASASSGRKWLRTRRAFSVVAGVLIVMVLSSATDITLESLRVLPAGPLYDTGLLLLATAYRVVYSIAASFMVARLAPDKPMRHALAFGGIGLLMSTIGVVVNAQMELGAMWYPVLLLALAMPCAWSGGKVSEILVRAANST